MSEEMDYGELRRAMLENENARLECENEQLSKLAKDMFDENDHLRELVEIMHSDMREMLGAIGKGSDTWGFCRYFGECLDCAETRMRELGIEVES